MTNEWFDIDPPGDDIDLSEFQERRYFELLEEGYDPDDAEIMAEQEAQKEEKSILRSRRCCPDGICRGWC